jgi:hypothetical protein
VHNKAKIQPAVRIDIRAFPKPKRQEEVCKDVANVMSPFVLANTMLPARTTMEEATFLLRYFTCLITGVMKHTA